MCAAFSNLLKTAAINRTRAALLLTMVMLASRAISSEPADTEFFERKIRPLLTQHCIACHGEKKQKGGLRLDTKGSWEKGGESGKVIVPRSPKTVC
jgi:hypothetical protein